MLTEVLNQRIANDTNKGEIMVEENKEFTPSPVTFVCLRCKSYYAGKIPVLDFKDPEFAEGKREKPPIIMTLCHGNHPVDPYEGKD